MWTALAAIAAMTLCTACSEDDNNGSGSGTGGNEGYSSELFTAAANLLQDSGFTTALINKKDASDEDYNAVFWFSCSMGACLYVIFFLAAPCIAQYYKAPELTSAARVLFLWFLFGCTGTVHNAILIKRLMMKEKTRADLLAFFASCVVALGMALCGMAYWSLAWQQIIYIAMVNIGRYRFTPWRPWSRIQASSALKSWSAA